MSLFDQTFSITLDDLKFVAVDHDFRAERTTKKAPNTLDLTVYNLSQSTLDRLKEKPAFLVTLQVGYGGVNHLIFSGRARTIEITKEGTETICKIAAADGLAEARKARVSKSYSAGATIDQVLVDCAKALGLGVGNLQQVSYEFRGLGATYPEASALYGNASQILSDVLRSCGFEYSIQNGAIHVVPSGPQTQGANAVLLSPKTGLIGAPRVEANAKTVICEALIIPGLYPGALVKIESETFTGVRRVRSAVYTGGSRGPRQVELDLK